MANPILTVKEARKVIGSKAKKYTDEEIEKLIGELSAIARLYIKSVPKF